MRTLLPLLLLALGACGRSAPDTWVLTDRPVPATVVATPAGDAVTALARDGHVYVRRVSAAGQMQAAVVVNPDSENVAVHAQAPPQVALLPDGALLVAWVRQIPVPGRRFPASELRVARSADGGRTFAPPFTASDDAGFLTGHHFHDLLVAPDGTVYLSWLDGRARDGARRTSPPVVPTAYGMMHEGHGGGHAAGEPGTELRVARSTDGGRTFAPSVVVAEGTCECCRTALATAPDGTLFVAWRHQFARGTRDVVVAHSTDGGQTFGAPVRLPAPPWQVEGCPHSGPSIAVTADGAVHAVWFTGAREEPGTYYARSTDGGQTFTSTRIATGNRIVQARLVADEGGVLALWESGTDQVLALGRPGTADAAVDTLAGHGPDLDAGAEVAWLVRQTDTQTLLQRHAR